MSDQPKLSAMQRYFAGLAETTFQSHLGVVDPPMIDYVSTLLIRFVRNDTMHSIRSITGRPMMTIAEMVAEASSRLGDARRELHQHIGDFTLFWRVFILKPYARTMNRAAINSRRIAHMDAAPIVSQAVLKPVGKMHPSQMYWSG